MKTPQPVDRRERVLLVGVALKRARRANGLARANADGVANRDSLDELQELAESAGAKIEGSLLQVRETLDPATLVGPRQARRNSRRSASPRRAAGDRGSRSNTRAAPQHGKGHRMPRDRPHAADSRYFRHARAHARRPAPGGARATELSAAAAHGTRRRALAARRRNRDARSRRAEARNRPAADPRSRAAKSSRPSKRFAGSAPRAGGRGRRCRSE